MRHPSFIAIAVFAIALGACSGKPEQSAGYRAACEGPPLRGVEAHERAMQDGYSINRAYDCIDKESYAAVQAEKAKWQAANTPEAKARREAEFAEQRARDEERRAREAVEETAKQEILPPVVLRAVDVKTASQADIAQVVSISAEVAAQVVSERNKRRFVDWADLVNRVVGLSAAQTAFYASVCGLTVNGKSLDGAPPDAAMATAIRKKYARYH